MNLTSTGSGSNWRRSLSRDVSGDSDSSFGGNNTGRSELLNQNPNHEIVIETRVESNNSSCSSVNPPSSCSSGDGGGGGRSSSCASTTGDPPPARINNTASKEFVIPIKIVCREDEE